MGEKSTRYLNGGTLSTTFLIYRDFSPVIFRRHNSAAQTDMIRSEVDNRNTEENSPRKLEKEVLDYLLQISQQLEKVVVSILTLYRWLYWRMHDILM